MDACVKGKPEKIAPLITERTITNEPMPKNRTTNRTRVVRFQEKKRKRRQTGGGRKEELAGNQSKRLSPSGGDPMETGKRENNFSIKGWAKKKPNQTFRNPERHVRKTVVW